MMARPVKNNPVAIVFISYVAIEVCKITGYVNGPSFQRIFALSDTQLGLIFGSLALGGIIINFSVGYFVNRFGVWAAWSAGMIGILAAVSAVLFARGFWSVFLPIFLFGMVNIMTLNANGTFLSDRYRGNAQQIMGLASGTWFGSSAISAPLFGCWVGWASEKGQAWLTYGVPYLFDLLLVALILAAAFRWLKPALAETDPVISQDQKGNENPSIIPPAGGWHRLCVLLIAFAHGCAVAPMLSWLNPMVQEKFGVGDFEGSAALAVMALGLGAGRISIGMGWVRMDNRKLLTISGLSGGSLLFIGLHMPNYPSTIAVIFAGGLMLSATAPCMLALVPEKFFSIKSHILGYIGASISVAAFAAPWLVGLMADEGFQIDKAMYITPASALLLAFVSFLWKTLD